MTALFAILKVVTGVDVKGIVDSVGWIALIWHLWNTATDAQSFFRAMAVGGMVGFLLLTALLIYAHFKRSGLFEGFRLNSWAGVLVVGVTYGTLAFVIVTGMLTALVQDVGALRAAAGTRGPEHSARAAIADHVKSAAPSSVRESAFATIPETP